MSVEKRQADGRIYCSGCSRSEEGTPAKRVCSACRTRAVHDSAVRAVSQSRAPPAPRNEGGLWLSLAIPWRLLMAPKSPAERVGRDGPVGRWKAGTARVLVPRWGIAVVRGSARGPCAPYAEGARRYVQARRERRGSSRAPTAFACALALAFRYALAPEFRYALSPEFRYAPAPTPWESRCSPAVPSPTASVAHAQAAMASCRGKRGAIV